MTDPKDPKFRDSVSTLEKLSKYSMSGLDSLACQHGVALRSVHENHRAFLGRVWARVTGRVDYDLAYSALALAQTLKGDTVPFRRRTPETYMRDKIQAQMVDNFSEIEREENRTDTEFLDLLRQV